MNEATPMTSRVLFVDDSQHLLSAVRRMLRGRADLVLTESAQEAIKRLETDPGISVVITDQNMPGMKGIEFLATVAERWPLVTRVMQTGNNDQDTAISAIHAGRVFRFLRKPYEPADLLDVIRDAQAEHEIRKAERILLETTLASSIKLVTEMLSLMRPELFAQSAQVNELVRALAPKLKLAQPWEPGLAALLYPLGLATLPRELLEKRRLGVRLNEAESFAIAQSGVVAGQLVAKIPKLERVAIYLRYSRKGHDGSGLPEGEIDPGIPPVALFLLPLLIDIVELADIRDISLGDAAAALYDNSERYHPSLLASVGDFLTTSTDYNGAHERIAREMAIGEIRVGDVLVNDLRSETGDLLLTGGTRLTDLTIKRLHMLQASRAIPTILAVARKA
ncbi:MAG: response regulator [Alphaproteobacteria bacterium]|nr:response regulator [Alphaproteobacteria bacterium]